ncbi:MAG: GNAT family N-acetyltransferase [Candidatus Hinthialibacter antarcticus]|nr:GNAT family N-acetyltransferase [Candidatus Hinthialibacter antarcticus]
MTEPNYSYHLVNTNDHEAISKIIELHIESFPDGIMNQLGATYIHHYYKALIESKQSGVIVCKHNNSTVGYIGFTVNHSSPEMKQLKKKINARLWFRLFTFRLNPIAVLRALIKKWKAKPVQCLPELTAFSVNKNHRRMGIGRMLVCELEKILIDSNQTEYIVFTDNEEGLRFYQKEQFETIFQFQLFETISACFKKTIKRNE